ncbi:hypothetical protein ES705_38040 [subsurface metagenome]
MNYFRYSFIFLLCLVISKVYSQELNCNVTVNTSQIQGTNKQIFTTLQTAIIDFMNNTSWTNNIFEVNERIECNLLFNITDEVSTGSFKATLNV